MGPNTVDDASGPVPPRERQWRHHPKDDAADQDGGAGGRAPAKRRFSGAGNTVELTLRYLNTRLDHVQGVRVAKPPPASYPTVGVWGLGPQEKRERGAAHVFREHTPPTDVAPTGFEPALPP